MITEEQGKLLINIARKSIEGYFSKKKYSADTKTKNLLNEKRPIFVTLYKKGNLRGCIGFTDSIYPMYEGAGKAALNAALSDPRFPPLESEELAEITIGVSVMTQPKMIEVRNPEEYLTKIIVGKDGIMTVGIFHSAILLPQVAVENKWDTETFLGACCRKASLPLDAWKDFNMCRVYKFQSAVYEEDSQNGQIKKVM